MARTLADGTSIVVRPVRAEDKSSLADGFERLSDDSRYRRFFMPKKELSEAELRYLTEVDHRDHEALAAFAAESGEPLGIARFVRNTDDLEAAEAAVAVVDDWQGRGVGSLLLEALADRAREEGIRRFDATLLESNAAPVKELFAHIGQPWIESAGSGTATLRLELPKQGLGSGLLTALRAAARGNLRVALTQAIRTPRNDRDRDRDRASGVGTVLVRAAGVGVAPLRALLRRSEEIDWEAEGLLKGAGDEDATADRIALLDELAVAGVPMDELRHAVAEERLAILPVERVLAGEERYSLEELADRAGMELEALEAQLAALGRPLPEPGLRCFDENDLQTAQTLAALVDVGIEPDVLRQTSRVLAQSAGIAAEAIRELFGDGLLRPGDSEREVGLRYATVTETLGPDIQQLVGHLLHVHLREQIRRDVVRSTERQAGQTADTVPVYVAFVDLVDFTALGERTPPELLGKVATQLGDLVADAAKPPVRLVKLVGDGAMLAAPEADPLLSTVRDIVDAVQRAGLPEVRGGVSSGDAVTRRGDLYGSVVNRAARICGTADPGQILAEDTVRASAAGLSWRSAGRRPIKGVSQPVLLHQLILDDAPLNGSGADGSAPARPPVSGSA